MAELVGTMLLLATVVGSGIMGERLAGGNVAIVLLANSLATGAVLVALILTFGPISGAHFNPLVTLVAAARREFPRAEVPGYIAAHLAGAVLGVLTAHLMFEEPLFALGQQSRSGLPLALSEFVAAFGLVAIVLGCARRGPTITGIAVGAWITAGYWFTASTSFANPAVTLARALTQTFTGIRLLDVPAFVVAQAAGALMAMVFFTWLLRPERRQAA